jgi:hypothetical protein
VCEIRQRQTCTVGHIPVLETRNMEDLRAPMARLTIYG